MKKITIEEINSLLSVVKMKVTKDENNDFHLCNLYKHLYIELDHNNDLIYRLATCLSYKSLWNVWKVIINANGFYERRKCSIVGYFDNPYFNCKSLEEAKIKRDLIAEN